MAMEIFDYLPPHGSQVRFRALQPNGQGEKTRLVRVEELLEVCAKTPLAKISVSYASLKRRQRAEDVERVYSVCIDLDGLATPEVVEVVRRRFPRAAIVHANGVTLLYKIPAAMSWEDAAGLAFQIGSEAEHLTDLQFDVGTLLRSDGTPARHQNHLFRFPAGWAAKRNAPVSFHPPATFGFIASDAAGLNYPRCSANVGIKSAVTSVTSLPQPTENSRDSLGHERKACSQALRIRARVLNAGGRIDEAIAEASKVTGKSLKDIAALFSRPGYEVKAFVSRAGSQCGHGSGDHDVGIIGLESSSRRFQWSRTMLSNFGHSLQGFWDVKCSPEIAYQGALEFKEFEEFRRWFRIHFRGQWKEAMWADVQRCWQKFGERYELKSVSKSCFAAIRTLLNRGPLSAVRIAEATRYSLTQIKRAIKLMAAADEVTFTGKTKAKTWKINPCHTRELGGRGGLSIPCRIEVHPFTRQHSVSSGPILRCREWTTPLGWSRTATCPTSLGKNMAPRSEVTNVKDCYALSVSSICGEENKQVTTSIAASLEDASLRACPNDVGRVQTRTHPFGFPCCAADPVNAVSECAHLPQNDGERAQKENGTGKTREQKNPAGADEPNKFAFHCDSNPEPMDPG